MGQGQGPLESLERLEALRRNVLPAGFLPRYKIIPSRGLALSKEQIIGEILREDFSQATEILGPSLQSFQGSCLLLTGANSMIGYYLVEYFHYLNRTLFQKPLQLVCVTRSEIGPGDTRLGHLAAAPHITWITQDLSRPLDLGAVPAPDYIIHAASPASPRKYLAEPLQTMDVNVGPTRLFLEYGRAHPGLRGFLFISSGEIYGSPPPESVPTPETYLAANDHLSERSCYVQAKIYAETLCRLFFRSWRLPVKMVRPIHVYGPGIKLDDGRVWADFINNALHGEDIRILSDGLARRAFCYLKDALLQMLAVILRGEDGEVYNIGNDSHVNIRELAQTVRQAAGNDLQVVVENNPPAYMQGTPEISCPSIKKVSRLLDFRLTPLEAGIKKTMEWARAVYDLP